MDDNANKTNKLLTPRVLIYAVLLTVLLFMLGGWLYVAYYQQARENIDENSSNSNITRDDEKNVVFNEDVLKSGTEPEVEDMLYELLVVDEYKSIVAAREDLIMTYPRNEQIHYTLGEAHYQLAGEQPTVSSQLDYLQRARNHYREAINTYTQYPEYIITKAEKDDRIISNNVRIILNRLGELFLVTGAAEQGLQFFEDVQEHDWNSNEVTAGENVNPVVTLQIGRMALGLGDTARAEAMFTQVREEITAAVETATVFQHESMLAAFYLARMQLDQGLLDGEEGIQDRIDSRLTQLELPRDSEAAQLVTARVAIMSGQYQEAITSMRSSVQRTDTPCSGCQQLLGEALLERFIDSGDVEDAKQSLEALSTYVEVNPHRSEPYLALGSAYAALGEFAEAQTAWRTGLLLTERDQTIPPARREDLVSRYQQAQSSKEVITLYR